MTKLEVGTAEENTVTRHINEKKVKGLEGGRQSLL
jgi:hypothetical protein